ncbi:DUF7878 domain-containing protein [Streptomyces sp. CB01201]|uniref:DUF7878 domain-containing protein n=1 Tax=Streptomyces sp. CB01201 TaxID=2020324 RepID=UPI001F384357|nr:hypothetical protein [Streptomyces sp. CB01201]
MRLVFRNIGAQDLPRRGYTPGNAPVEALLLDIEADLSIEEGGRTLWSEEFFQVAELAYELARWLQVPEEDRGNFELDSMDWAERGVIRIVRSEGGWRVGTVLEPDLWTAPMSWDDLVAEIRRFDGAVREATASLGIDPDFIPSA